MSLRHNLVRGALAVAASVALFATAACGSTSQSASGNDIAQATVHPGKITLATSNPAYTPWMYDNDPANGKGYESALLYKVAEKLGFDKKDIEWTRVQFDPSIAPGPKDFDLNIQQFSITPERKKAVDFSAPYYRPTQSVVVKKDGKFAKATTVGDLKDAKIGAMVGTTSYNYAKKAFGNDVSVYNDNAALAQALNNNQIDGFVWDTPSCVNAVKSNQAKNAVVVGQLPNTEDVEGYGIVLPKNSKLTAKVTAIIEDFTKDGTLEKLQEQWLKEYTIAIPTLKQ